MAVGVPRLPPISVRSARSGSNAVGHIFSQHAGRRRIRPRLAPERTAKTSSVPGTISSPSQKMRSRAGLPPEHLGIQGGSQGGLLVGTAFTQRPDLFNAAIVQIPLFDMLRYLMVAALPGPANMAIRGSTDSVPGSSPIRPIRSCSRARTTPRRSSGPRPPTTARTRRMRARARRGSRNSARTISTSRT